MRKLSYKSQFNTWIYIRIGLVFIVMDITTSFDCQNVITISSEGLLSYLATVKFQAPISMNGEQWNLEMKTDNEFTFLGGWGIWVISKPAEGKATFRSRDENITLVEGEDVSFNFRIHWFTDEPRPIVISMIWQGQQICKNSSQTQPILAVRRRRMDENDQTIRVRGGSRRRMRFPVN